MQNVVNSRHPAWGLKQTVKSLEAYIVFPRSREQTQSILQPLATTGARRTPSAILGLARKRLIIKNKESDIAHDTNITTIQHIRYGISATKNNPFAKHNLSNVSYSEMRRLNYGWLTVAQGRVSRDTGHLSEAIVSTPMGFSFFEQ